MGLTIYKWLFNTFQTKNKTKKKNKSEILCKMKDKREEERDKMYGREKKIQDLGMVDRNEK